MLVNEIVSNRVSEMLSSNVMIHIWKVWLRTTSNANSNDSLLKQPPHFSMFQIFTRSDSYSLFGRAPALLMESWNKAWLGLNIFDTRPCRGPLLVPCSRVWKVSGQVSILSLLLHFDAIQYFQFNSINSFTFYLSLYLFILSVVSAHWKLVHSVKENCVLVKFGC